MVAEADSEGSVRPSSQMHRIMHPAQSQLPPSLHLGWRPRPAVVRSWPGYEPKIATTPFRTNGGRIDMALYKPTPTDRPL